MTYEITFIHDGEEITIETRCSKTAGIATAIECGLAEWGIENNVDMFGKTVTNVTLA